jgi:hypothetical protein
MTADVPDRGGFLDRIRRFPSLLLTFLVVCFLVQGTAVQSHVHFIEHTSSATAAAGNSHIEAAPSKMGDSPADCPLCQEAAIAGAYVLPAVPVLLQPPAPALWITPTALSAFSLAPLGLGWLSRAPPE